MEKFIKILIKPFVYLLNLSPVRVKFFLGDALGVFLFDIVKLRRDVVLGNLNIAFPEKSDEEKVKIARASMRNLARGLMEYSYLPFLNKDNYKELITIENVEYLHEALKKNKGVCLLSLHLGQGDIAVHGMGLEGLPVYLVSKEFKVRWLNKLWFDLRGKSGVKFIPPRNSTQLILKALRANNAVIFVMDQFMGPPIGVKTKFFGKETGTAFGLTVIAKRTKAPVIPIYALRLPNGKHKLIFEKEIPLEIFATREETLTNMTQIYNDWIEQKVREHPEQWMWLHKRWKEFRH